MFCLNKISFNRAGVSQSKSLGVKNSRAPTQDAEEGPFRILHNDVRAFIFEQLSPSEIGVCSQVCRHWRDFLKSSDLLEKSHAKLENRLVEEFNFPLRLAQALRRRNLTYIKSYPKESHTRSFLTAASKAGLIGVARLLIENGTPAEWKNSQETELMPLHVAACPKMAQLLLKHGANINRPYGRIGMDTPLATAIQDEREETALFLLELGANPRYQIWRQEGRSSPLLKEAVKRNLSRAAERLMEKDHTALGNRSAHTELLCIAVQNKNLRMITLLVVCAGGTKLILNTLVLSNLL